MKQIYLIGLFLILLISCKKKNESVNANQTQYYDWLKTSGSNITDKNGHPILLQGVAFGNEVWTDTEIPLNHHSEIDYQRIHSMGMNVVRFYLNYKTFEDDANPYQYKQSGWDWIDTNIKWAKENKVYLILNMHVPQGGFQSLGNGTALWDIVENQNRFKALWKTIALKYKDEPTIAGYDLLNEPVTTQSIDQWKNLAQSTIDSIRTIDLNHIIFVERLNAVGNNWSNDANMNFIDLNDSNLCYEFHFYSPIEYTHQGASWIQPPIPIGEVYPNEKKVVLNNPNWLTATFNTTTTPTGTFDWTYINGEPLKYKITNTKIATGKPALINQLNTGTLWFDQLVIKEFDPNGNFVQIIDSIDLGIEDGGFYWSADNSGAKSIDNSIGYLSNTSIKLSGSTSDANYAMDKYRFIPKQNYYYSISGWVKGDQVPNNALARFRIDFESGDAYYLNKEYLISLIEPYYQVSKSKGRALYLGEFGVINNGFNNGRGGVQWVSDMIDILQERNAHFTYHTYHEDAFGIYKGYGKPIDPNQSNVELIQLFTNKLK
jgi:endoglucanase